MIFLKLKFLPVLVIMILVFVLAYLILESKFYAWVKEHWLLERRIISRISSFMFLAGIVLLSVVLLDPRSGEQKIKGMVKQDKTIILIDTSTSMLTEDIRPNRLEKAVLIAKHFSRKAVGHQISVMVFADITKKIVPFTSDLDLLDSRIDSVKMLKNMNAGSSIGLAIEEAVRYFDPKNESIAGNILVITDGEDNADTESFKVPEGIHLALIGVGTKNGGPIPMKDNFGMFYGQKKSHGVTVISRLNEDFFKKAVSDNPNSKYFIVENYDLPTEEVIDFFSKQKTAEKEGENVIRPVALEFWAIPGLILLSLSLIFRFFKPLTLIAFLVVSLTNTWAQEKKEEIQIPAEVQTRLDLFKNGKLNRDEKINLADQLVKLKMHESAQKIYKENFDLKDHVLKPDSYFNWATSELESGNIQDALSKYSELEDESSRGNVDKSFKDKINENIKKMLVAPPSKDKNKSKEEKDKEKQDQDKNQGNPGESDPKDGESKQGQGKSDNSNGDKEDNKKNPFDPKNKDEPKDGKGEEDPNKEKDKPKDGEKQQSPSDTEGKDQGEKKPKVSPLLEQLKQDDRKLQLKLLDTSTQKRKEGRKKDW